MNLRMIRDYERMMADPVRMRAYAAAIREHCPGKVVCEVGVGLGPLSLMALQAGATRVYGIEALPHALELATGVIRANGFGDRFVPVGGMSYDVELPERVDVVISETLDSSGLGENTVAAMSDAARRFLVPGGRLVPSHLGCAIALAAPAAFDERIRFWRETMFDEYGLDYSALGQGISVVDHNLDVAPDEVMSQWTTWQEVALADERTLRERTGLLIEVERPGRITGFATAFVAVVGDILLSTFPGQAGTHWQQGFMPFPEPIDAERGDLVCVSVKVPDQRDLTIALKKKVVHVPAAHADAFRAQLAAIG